MIDGGGFSDNSSFDVGSRIIAPLLWGKKIKTVEQLMKICARRGIYTPAYARMEREHLISGVQLELLYPPQDFMDQKKSDKWRSTNNNSLVVKVSYGEVSFLFTGDIMAPAERELLAAPPRELASTIVVAPHHGSATSSTLGFVRAISPRYALFSVGYRNRYGFPKPDVTRRWRSVGAKLLATADTGAIQFRLNSSDGIDGPELARWRQRRYWTRLPADQEQEPVLGAAQIQ